MLNMKVTRVGIEITIKKKSSLFQFDLKKFLNPNDLSLTESSIKKINVIKLSAIDIKYLWNIEVA